MSDEFKGRWELFEWHDLPQCPQEVRSFITSVLCAGWQFSPYAAAPSGVDVATEILRDVLDQSGETRIIDMCSGSGGPIPALVTRLRYYKDYCKSKSIEFKPTQGAIVGAQPIEGVLTDLYPHLTEGKEIEKTCCRNPFADEDKKVAGGDAPYVTYYMSSVNATKVPAELTGLRTIMAAFHHFSPTLAEGILRNCVENGNPFCTIELANRSFLPIVAVIAATMVAVYIFPLLGLVPMSKLRVLLIYITPVYLFFMLWDGIVSCLRTYTEKEFLALAARADPEGKFEWKTGSRMVTPSLPLSLKATYYYGIPKKQKKKTN